MKHRRRAPVAAVVELASLAHYDELFGVDPAPDTVFVAASAILAVAS